ncbi:unnamed protein product [Pleuronectes platessa]|uniref:Uncharacterized protein n=1 Tax=Pleuronectes platessa TaxID=8262 RepID=A0A9N7U7G2_PLEPL|nr:unnamed protein product [Pleuronectes platessa]
MKGCSERERACSYSSEQIGVGEASPKHLIATTAGLDAMCECKWFQGSLVREGKSAPEAVRRKVSYKEKLCLVPKQKTELGRTGHNALSPAGLLRSITSSSSSTGWNPTGGGLLTETWLGKLQQNQNNKRLTPTWTSRTGETQPGQGQTVQLTAEQ